jgi:NAD(P)-dependent dehydrogenase (short-subunit alcohol dehydrogenase family)
VINLSSTLGSLTSLSDPAHPLFGLNILAYNSSKTALNAITVSLAKDLRVEGVAVVAVCPGWVRTDMGGEGAPRSVEEGARIVVQVATDPEPPTGLLLDENGPIAW